MRLFEICGMPRAGKTTLLQNLRLKSLNPDMLYIPPLGTGREGYYTYTFRENPGLIGNIYANSFVIDTVSDPYLISVSQNPKDNILFDTGAHGRLAFTKALLDFKKENGGFGPIALFNYEEDNRLVHEILQQLSPLEELAAKTEFCICLMLTAEESFSRIKKASLFNITHYGSFLNLLHAEFLGYSPEKVHFVNAAQPPEQVLEEVKEIIHASGRNLESYLIKA